MVQFYFSELRLFTFVAQLETVFLFEKNLAMLWLAFHRQEKGKLGGV